MIKSVMLKLLIALLLLAADALAQQKNYLHSTIAYIAGQTVYLNAGRVHRVFPGDTAFVYHDDREIGSVIVTAIADSSSAATILQASTPFSIGDTVGIRLSALMREPGLEGQETQTESPRNASGQSKGSTGPKENILSGRIALQYNLIVAEDSKLNLNQPAAVLQMNVGNFLGAGMSLQIYGIGYFDPNGVYGLYGNRSGLAGNIYLASLSGETRSAAFGYSVGRFDSPFAAGLGTFDGAQVYSRVSNFTIGVIAGGAPTVPSSTLGFPGTKTAAFVSYHSSGDIYHRYDGTLAYSLRMVNGNLDRNFLYLQNTLGLGEDLSLYESSEIDMSRISNGIRKGGLNFSNTFLSVNYFPEEWLFANIGYDAYRNVYLYQSMRSIPDSLIDMNITQGFRAGVTAYLPASFSVSLNGSYRTRRDFIRDEHTVGGSVRSSDLLGLGVGMSIRYTGMIGVYSNANDVTFEIDRTFFDALDLTLSYDSYDISVSTLQQTFTTQTISGFFDYSFSQKWYTSLGLDDVIDPSMNSFRIFAELGFRF